MQKKLTLVSVGLLLSSCVFAQQITLEQYINLYAPIAVSEMMRSGIPASITLAQGLLESGVGNSQLATEGKNHFGIKCHENWQGETMTYDDDADDECFRKYPTPEDSYRDHTDFLMTRGRYSDLFSLDKTDYTAWAKGLKADGYATDPNYATRLVNLIEANNLEQFDTVTNYDIWIAGFREDEPEIHEQNEIEPDRMYASQDVFYFNRIKTVIARPGDIPLQIALHFSISLSRLYKYNDMYEGDMFSAGEKIYLQPKRSKGDVEYHEVKEGETMRSISQEHGIKLDKLYERNKMALGFPAQWDPKLGIHVT